MDCPTPGGLKTSGRFLLCGQMVATKHKEFRMTKAIDYENSDGDVLVDQLDELLKMATEPCSDKCEIKEVCDKHNALVRLVRYLAKMTKNIWQNQNEIKSLMREIKDGQKYLVRTRRILLWGVTILGGAVLAKWGEAIFLAVKAVLSASGTPTP